MGNLLNKIGKGIVFASLIGLSFLSYEKEKKEVFLTGFGDAPHFKDNPTKELMKRFEKKGYNVIVLNTDYNEAPSKLNEIYNKFKPKKIISLGLSKMTVYLDVTVAAENMMEDSIPDNSGNIYRNRVIDSIYPKKIHMPESNTKKLISNFEKKDIQFYLDSTTSTYVCNSLLFKGITLNKEKGVEFYFFHVPEDILKNRKKMHNLEKAIETIVKN